MNRRHLLFCFAALVAACSAAPPQARPVAANGLGLEEVRQQAVPFGTVHRARRSGGRIFVAAGQAGLRILDGAGRTELGKVEFPAIPHRSLDRQWSQVTDGEVSDVSVLGASAFVLVQRRGYDSNRTRVALIDVSDVSRPRLQATCLLKGTASRVVALEARRAVVLRQPGGSYPPNNEGLLSLLEFDGQELLARSHVMPAPRGIKLDESFLRQDGVWSWVQTSGGPAVVDWSQTAGPVWNATPPGSPPAAEEEVRLPNWGGEPAHVTWSDNGFAVTRQRPPARRGNRVARALGRRGVSVEEGGSPLFSFFDDARGRMSVMDVHWTERGELLVADADNGLYVLSPQGKLVGFCSLPNALSVASSGRVALVANGSYGVAAVSLDDLQRPRLTPLRDCVSVACSPEGRIGVLDSGRLREMRLVPGGVPVPQLSFSRTIPLPMGIPRKLSVGANGQRLCIANDEGWNIVQLDISQPSHPKLERVLATGGFARGVSLEGDGILATSHATAQMFTLNTNKPLWTVPVPKAGHCALTREQAWAETPVGVVGLHRGTGLPSGSLNGHTALSSWPGGLACADSEQVRWYNPAGVEQGSLPVSAAVASAGWAQRICWALPKELLWLEAGKAAQRTPLAQPVGALDLDERWLVTAGTELTLWDLRTRQPVASRAAVRNAGTYGGRVPRFVDAKLCHQEGRVLVAGLDAFYGLRLYSVPDLRPLGEFATNGGDYTGISVDQGTVYVGNNWGGLYRLGERGAERLVAATPNPGCTGPLVVNGRAYYQGNEDRRLYITEGDRLLSSIALPGRGDSRRFGGTFPALRGNLLYTPGFGRVLDVSNPTQPRVLRENAQIGFAHDGCLLTTLNGKLYQVLSGEDAVTVVDGDTAAIVSRLPGDFLGGYYFGRGMQMRGSDLLICNRAQLNVVSLKNPARPQLTAQLALTGTPCDLAVRGSYAYVATYFGGLEVVDLDQPGGPKRVAHYQRGAYVDAGGVGWDNLACIPCVGISEDVLYCGEYYSGVQLWKLP